MSRLAYEKKPSISNSFLPQKTSSDNFKSDIPPQSLQNPPKKPCKHTDKLFSGNSFFLPPLLTCQYGNKSPLLDFTDSKDESFLKEDPLESLKDCVSEQVETKIPDWISLDQLPPHKWEKFLEKNRQKIVDYSQDKIKILGAGENGTLEIEKYVGVKSERPKLEKLKRPQKQPKYIEACECGKWSLKIEKISTGEQWIQKFKCRSWRHLGECSKWRGKQDFVRIKKGIEKLGNGWVYLCLTFDRSDDLYSSYRKIVDCWDILRKRITRYYGKFSYITLIEKHKDEYPHVNVLIQNDSLYSACIDNSTGLFGWNVEREKFFNNATFESGFGTRYYIEPMRSKDAISGYFVKLVGQMAGELTKQTTHHQNPLQAPPHFRRLRASRGLLEKIIKDEDLTGELIQQPIEKILKDYIEQEKKVPSWLEKQVPIEKKEEFFSKILENNSPEKIWYLETQRKNTFVANVDYKKENCGAVKRDFIFTNNFLTQREEKIEDYDDFVEIDLNEIPF